MILDSSLAFDNSAAITVTRDSTNIIDLGVARDLGIMPDIWLAISATTAFTAAGAATLTIALQGAPDAGGTPGTWTTYQQSPALTLAQVNTGFLFPGAIPRPPSSGVPRPRYLKLVYTVATGPMTAGSIFAGLVLTPEAPISYPSNYSVQNV